MSLSDSLKRIEEKLQSGWFDKNYKPVTQDYTSPEPTLANNIQALMGGASRFDHDNSQLTPALEFMRACGGDALLLGGVGSGKTTACVVATAEKMKPGVSAKFLTAYDLAFMIHQKDFKALDSIERVSILIIDDLGTEPEGFKGKDFLAHFENLFATRHRKCKRTLITSNLTVDQIKQAYGDRFISRLRQSGQVFETDTKDMRRPQ